MDRDLTPSETTRAAAPRSLVSKGMKNPEKQQNMEGVQLPPSITFGITSRRSSSRRQLPSLPVGAALGGDPSPPADPVTGT
ncbi:hypothetical protein EYF80_062160 [Liparis tanakae]|uniref:Uncharacterized protein n=1 Tax=Liparis tanakae TaxID=230148 RepID=A0A4Z2EGT6_9TELE|nr:hypothetical protein EYF80_062160 [Liparis tanakae]